MKTALINFIATWLVGLIAAILLLPVYQFTTPPPHPVTDFSPLDPFIPRSWSVLKKTDNHLHQYVDLKRDDQIIRVFVAKRGQIKHEEELVDLVRKKLIDSGCTPCAEDPHSFLLGTDPEAWRAYLKVVRTTEPVVVVVSYHSDLHKAVQALTEYLGGNEL